jgi:hypothetical protein
MLEWTLGVTRVYKSLNYCNYTPGSNYLYETDLLAEHSALRNIDTLTAETLPWTRDNGLYELFC